MLVYTVSYYYSIRKDHHIYGYCLRDDDMNINNKNKRN